MTRTRIFISFDHEHDSDLRRLLEEQSRRPGSSFLIMGTSSSMSTQRARGTDARPEIRAADEVIIICGEHTHESLLVATELAITHEEEKPYMLLWGRRDRMCMKPDGARNADAMYSWTREIFENQIMMTLRNSKPIAVPDNCKRMPSS
jgi:hypothetical protein